MKAKSPRWRVAAVQMEFRPTVAANLDSILEHLGQAAEVGADVVLFPECAVTGYGKALEQLAADEVEGALAEIARAARRTECNVLVGAPTFERGRWYNSLVAYAGVGGQCPRGGHQCGDRSRAGRTQVRARGVGAAGVPASPLADDAGRVPEPVAGERAVGPRGSADSGLLSGRREG